jgi:type IV pilus assembly protein PilB
VDSILNEFTETAIDFTATEAELAATAANADDDSAPVIRLCNLIITEAVNLRASDIHIEPFENRIRIRYRIDGVLIERDSPPRRLLAAITSRFKIMGSIDISEKRRPQDGRIKGDRRREGLGLARQSPAQRAWPGDRHAHPESR